MLPIIAKDEKCLKFIQFLPHLFLIFNYEIKARASEIFLFLNYLRMSFIYIRVPSRTSRLRFNVSNSQYKVFVIINDFPFIIHETFDLYQGAFLFIQ